MAAKHIIFTVTNDLSFDQRMRRICGSLHTAGYNVTLIGRKRVQSSPLAEQPFQQHRIKCWFDGGKAFYLEYNLRLLLYLLRTRANILGAVDLDTAVAVYIAAKIRGIVWTFDSHEFYSELEEVVRRPFVHKVWSTVERFIVKRAKHRYTISEGYADLFEQRYNRSFQVVRNVPTLEPNAKLEESQGFIIYQGALNMGRGLEESIEAMHKIDNLNFHIYGDGPIKSKLETLITTLNLQHKVQLKGSVSPDELREITPRAFAGLTLFSTTGLHHRHSLANRFFDYIHAGIPQICVDYPEYNRFNHSFEIALTIEQPEPALIAAAIQKFQEEKDFYEKLKKNTAAAAEAHNWQRESRKLIELYQGV